jgi:putative CocE/NonD family hydrolase
VNRLLAAPALTLFLLLAQQARSGVDSRGSNPEALAGEYTNPDEPATPFSFYLQNGKLVVESERLVPTELNQVSSTQLATQDRKTSFQFTLDNAGRGASLTISGDARSVYQRSGEAVHHVFRDYRRSEAMIPMRDGVRLHAVILKPADIAAGLPFLIERTPYGVDRTDRAELFAARPELARAGYIFVSEDIRGRYKSQGKFVMMRPLADHTNPKAIDESTDAYDTVAWLLANVAGNNGRAGFIGTSYDGFLAAEAGIDPHPGVKAISPQAPMIDTWLGDDFFHNGAFRQSYGYDYVLSMESSKGDTEVSYGKDKAGNAADGFSFFLSRGSFEQDVKKSKARVLPTWKHFFDDPSYDRFWQNRGVENTFKQIAVPTLTVGGYYDQEDMWGPQELYEKLESHDAHGDNFLVLGPWRHGYWSSSSVRLGSVDYGEPIGREYRERIEAPFFAHYLKGEEADSGNPFARISLGSDSNLVARTITDTVSFQTGSNKWRLYSQFPPASTRTTKLFLESQGQLGWSAPTADSSTSYTSDPADPIPYRHRPIQPTYSPGSEWYNWLTEDQRFVTGRKDVAVWKLPVLSEDLTVTGELVADIFASTTGSDGDLVVKLIDEYSDDDSDPKMRGYQLMTNAEIFRGRYLSSFELPTALVPGSIHEHKFSLHDVDHVFKAGHRVVVELQSTWFPLYDRNPQTFVPNIMKARPSDYRAATITIYSDPGHASSLLLPVAGKEKDQQSASLPGSTQSR